MSNEYIPPLYGRDQNLPQTPYFSPNYRGGGGGGYGGSYGGSYGNYVPSRFSQRLDRWSTGARSVGDFFGALKGVEARTQTEGLAIEAQNARFNAARSYYDARADYYNGYDQGGGNYQGNPYGYYESFAPYAQQRGYGQRGYGQRGYGQRGIYQNGGYFRGPQGNGYFPPQGVNNYGYPQQDYGGQVFDGSQVPELNLITLADNVVKATNDGNQEAARSYATEFAALSKLLVHDDGKIHVRKDIREFAAEKPLRRVSRPEGTPEEVALRLLNDLNASPQARELLLGAVTGGAVQTGQETTTQSKTPETPAQNAAPTNFVGALPEASKTPAKTYGKGVVAPSGLAKNQVAWLQELLTKAGYDLATTKHPDGKDGMYGTKTAAAVNAIIAKVNGLTLSDVNFADSSNPKTVTFLEQLNKEIAAKQGNATTQTVATQGPTPEQQAEAARKAQEDAIRQAAKQRYDDAVKQESTRFHIVVDLPNDLAGKATVRNLVGFSSHTSGSGEEIEFNLDDNRNNGLLKDYVAAVRQAMDAQGLNPSRQTVKETAGMILAAYNGISTSDPISDLTRLRIPNPQDVWQSIAAMRNNVLNDPGRAKIDKHEFNLSANDLQNVVQPVPPPDMQRALAQARNLVQPLPNADPRSVNGDPVTGTTNGQTPTQDGGRGGPPR